MTNLTEKASVWKYVQRHTKAICKPSILNIMRIPDGPRELCPLLINTHKLYQFLVYMWISEGFVRHKIVIKMFALSLEGSELSYLGLSEHGLHR